MAKDKPQPQGGPDLAEYITTAEPKAYAGSVPVFCAHDAIVPIKDLQPNPKNPNQHPPEQIKLLASIIRATGWRAPITVSKRSGLVTKGHGRLMAAQLDDLTDAPVDYQDYASEAEGPKNNTTYRNYKSPYQLEAAVADGRAVKADTLEELVAKIYPDDTAAQQTALDSIQRYNELAKAGYDEDFHKPASRMWAVENGPFYADKFTTALLLVCIGGLESDEDCHTFDADRNVIPGLYVAGNIQGNRFATEYPIGLKGVSHSMAMYYGYVAGKNALKDI